MTRIIEWQVHLKAAAPLESLVVPSITGRGATPDEARADLRAILEERDHETRMFLDKLDEEDECLRQAV